MTSDRLDYGQMLRVPAGFRLDQGVATTFTLDLETLVAVSLALTLDQTLEGEISGERIALLESLDRLQGRFKVFYQRGNIKVPASFNRLFTLLETLLVPSTSYDGDQAEFASFHPKVWLLRFEPVDIKSSPRFRLIVLSRNLTFDRSWDLAVQVDGVISDSPRKGDQGLLTFLRSLSSTPMDRQWIESLCDSLKGVDWILPPGVDKIAMLPGLAPTPARTGCAPIDLSGPIDQLLVVSPFVDAGPNSLLQQLAVRTRGTKTLISRPDTLDAIGSKALAGWELGVLSERVVSGEERLQKEAPAMQSLHAKLIVAKQGSRAIWHVGSANMTNAAFGEPLRGILPRNREFMLRLVGKNGKMGPGKLLETWETSGAFEPHAFRDLGAELTNSDRYLRRIVHQLTSASWSMQAKRAEEGNFTLDLSVTPLPRLPDNCAVTVSLLCREMPKKLEATQSWSGVPLADLSAFVLVKLCTPDHGEREFAIQAKFSADLMDERRRALFKETIGSKEKLIQYLALILDARASKSQWFRVDGVGHGADIFGLNDGGTLYEQLLRAASRSRDRLHRALWIYEKSRQEGIELPPGLDELFQGFASFDMESL